MPSFEELDLAPELVEALAAEGIETPTAFQREALPVIRRGNSLLGVAGPGAGTMLAYGAALLDRFEAGGGLPRGVVVTPTADAADRSARSLAPLARVTGHRVAALGGRWALPERADLLFASADALLVAVRDSRVKLDALEAFVVDGAAALEELQGLEGLQTIFGFLPAGGQRVILTLPLTPGVSDFADAHLKKSVRVPAAAGGAEAPARGDLRYVIAGEEKGDAILEVTAALLDADARHVLAYFRSDDQAADMGDFLGLHGYAASSPGDEGAPVWLGVDEHEARGVLQGLDDAAGVATVSVDLPPDADSLDRRHGAGGERVVLVLPRELPHLRAIAGEAGYRLLPGPAPRPTGIEADLASFRERVGQALDEEDLTPHLLLLEPLFRDHAPAEVAAALAALLRRSGRMPAATDGAGDAAVAVPAHQATPARAPAWVHLFVSLGSRDGIGPGDLVGAVTGEAGVAGSQVGKVEIRDTFSRVEVEESVARRVIQALNGVTVRGRSVRVDYDRKEPRGREGAKGGTRPGPRQRRSQARGRDRTEGPDGSPGADGGDERK